MIRRLRAFYLVLAMSTFVTAQSPSLPQAITDPTQLQSKPKTDLQNFTIEKLYTTRSIGGSSWSPDGKQVVFVSNISGRQNLWLVPAEGGWPLQLTISDQRQAEPAWSPDGRSIAFVSDNDGNELWNIFLVSPQNGEVVNLTAASATSNLGPAWSPDSKRVAYITRAKTSASYEVDVIDVEMRKTAHITHDTPREWSNGRPTWSHDGKWLAWTQHHASGKNSNVLVAEVASGKVLNLTAHAGDITYSAASWSPDGKKLLIASNAANGFENVALLDLEGQLRWLASDKRDMHAGNYSPDGAKVTWTVNVDGNTAIYLLELATKKPELLPLGMGLNSLAGADTAFSRDGRHLLISHAGADAPGELVNLNLAAKNAQQITNSLVAGLHAEDMVQPSLARYPSRDGKWQISALVYIPHNIVKNAHYPAIVWIHGGPSSQTMNGFNRFIQYIVNQGYVVIAPNYRGSTGYGKLFNDANRMDAGGGELEDVLDAAEFIRRSGFVDAKKLIVMGASYGGYLSMMALTKAPDVWAGAVPIVPFVNWFTEFQNEEPQLQEYDRLFMGDPVKDKALWEDRSPINFIDRIKAPLLLLAGENDPRCPPSEAKQVADAIRKHGGSAQLKIYANEGHSFSRLENQIDAYRRASDFIKSHVPSPGCGCTVLE
ncbi:MAG: S9 family peptidase [Candidatus Korobacteraceae bacterium]|jgi:dipeptidyl aminopeptidase/acylaminoacyl peptidase